MTIVCSHCVRITPTANMALSAAEIHNGGRADFPIERLCRRPAKIQYCTLSECVVGPAAARGRAAAGPTTSRRCRHQRLAC